MVGTGADEHRIRSAILGCSLTGSAAQAHRNMGLGIKVSSLRLGALMAPLWLYWGQAAGRGQASGDTLGGECQVPRARLALGGKTAP